MLVQLHPGIQLRLAHIGRERAPLLVVDNFCADPDALVRIACASSFTVKSPYFPGIRASAPADYQQAFSGIIRDAIVSHFSLRGAALRFPTCDFSLVTTPRDRLQIPQKVPHVDSIEGSGLASIHYLFKRDLGGTAFYRHRKTGFEFIDETRVKTYVETINTEFLRPEDDGYINGDTPLFEQVASEAPLFNRLLIYRRNSLHSGSIARDFVPDPNPATGRLSINSFIDGSD